MTLLVLLSACQGGSHRVPDDPDGLTRGILAAAPPRFIEARLAGAERYARCDTTGAPPGRCTPAPAPGTPDFTPLAKATERVRAHADGNDWAEGLAELAWYGGSPRTLDRAVASLQAAAAAHPSDWRIATDLAVAYMVRASAQAQPLDNLRALDVLEEANTPGHEAAPLLFDRAIVLERIGLWEQVAEAWTAYLSCDATTAWAEEARRRKARAREILAATAAAPDSTIEAAYRAGGGDVLAALASAHPRQARELALSRLAPEAVRGDSAGVTRALDALARLGDALGDRSVSDMVSEIRVAKTRGPGAFAPARAALASYGQASAEYRAGHYAKAVTLYAGTELRARDVLPTLATWAALGAGAAELTIFHYDQAGRWFDTVLETADEERHPVQVGRALWGKGLIAARTAHPEDGWRLLVRAGELYRKVGEGENVAFLLANASLMLAQLGRPRQAWPYRLETLAALGREVPSVRLHYALWQTAEAAVVEGLPHAAAVLQDADVRLGRRLGTPWLLAEALLRRSDVRLSAGDSTGASADVREATGVAAHIDNGDMRRRELADVWVAKATLISARDPHGAATLLDSAIAVQHALGNVVFVATDLTERAKAHVAAGDRDAAAQDFEDAVELIENQRAGLTTEEMGTTFGTAWQQIFDAAITFQIRERRAPWRALEYAERSRRLFLTGAELGPAERWSDVTGLPPVRSGTMMIEFIQTGRSVFRWVVTPRAREFEELPLSADSLAHLVADFTDGLRRGSPEVGPGRLLGSVLIPSMADTRTSRVVVVPDHFLNALPFAALPLPGTGQRVVERAAVSVAPGFDFFLARAGKAPIGRPGSALLVGNPRPGVDSSLADLPGAEGEVRSVRGLYDSSKMLLGAGATRAAFLREIDTHPVLHFAGHAVFDDESPDASYLVLAPGNSGDSDRLYVRELAGARFRRLRLVVLSACSSIAPAPGRGGGLWGLAQPFLARGAVDVVGSVWPVDDRPVAALMTAFHAALLRGAEPAVALQEAQRMALASSDPALASPAAWAAFVVLGG